QAGSPLPGMACADPGDATIGFFPDFPTGVGIEPDAFAELHYSGGRPSTARFTVPPMDPGDYVAVIAGLGCNAPLVNTSPRFRVLPAAPNTATLSDRSQSGGEDSTY